MADYKLNKWQISEVIDHLFPRETKAAINAALAAVILNDITMYKAEDKFNLPHNSLAKRMKRLNTEIAYLEGIYATGQMSLD